MQVLESLPGIESLTDYTFKYGRNPLLELPLAVNPTGCARSEPKLRTHVKRIHNFQRWAGSVFSLFDLTLENRFDDSVRSGRLISVLEADTDIFNQIF